MCYMPAQVASTSLDLELPVEADEQSINFTLAQLIMVMERLDTLIGTMPPSTVHCLIWRNMPCLDRVKPALAI